MARHNKKPRLTQTVYIRLKSMYDAGVGTSKYDAKKDGSYRTKIFSSNTLRTYVRECKRFVLHCQQQYGCKTLRDCREHIGDYLTRQQPNGKPYSAASLHTQAAAICKLYGMDMADLSIKLPERRRIDITRSRNDVANDRNVSDATRRVYADFCRCTGLRRRELAALTGDCLAHNDKGRPFIHVKNGKGGKQRYAPIIGTDEEQAAVIRLFADAGRNKLFAHVNSAVDIHSYRAEYATRLYHMIARDPATLPQADRYYCRKDKAGTVYDRGAMAVVSQALGHNRVDVIAQSYLRY